MDELSCGLLGNVARSKTVLSRSDFMRVVEGKIEFPQWLKPSVMIGEAARLKPCPLKADLCIGCS